ncbi:3-deoxy-D-manno-octulosonic-acid transferase [Pseudoxanthomonas japonensis]|mgnify:CR=1 FL=1|uniref:lipid IV(A) 3-deoxy-D-manno-octulosonic acid transferase n=1 Tax=Pseudoxanthomonas TaxID=83618 RepID=UPI00078241C0|nr:MULTISPECIES: lipid IV(A) 3-deoxy-D-manno-octulosonic acid transferase [Pseudoxanthomonas]MBA3928188.1 3-deoxy-D-manno-octulosonic acid transferase [Xanthomonas sp.]MBL8255725.1 lipid IV(A) 3-deoxy-D-manno-octulosonic acid transferase [Pseudoxanthomonas mexicana]MDR7068215.1 3-deoxy-D-manno-octulosonic-acid transferase [Pseudoxanthomonas japonensis]
MSNRTAERLLRALYSVVLYVLTPVTVYHLIWRGFRYPDYFQRWNERYGSYDMPGGTVDVWLHAVSVGEVNAAAPVVDALLKRHRGLRLLITTITPTGSQRVQALWGDRVLHVYSPYDLPGAVARFLTHFPPRLALIMETELWPSLLFGCHDRRVPVYILNARLSARSLRGYSVLRPLIARTLRTVRKVAAQSEDDAGRFVQLGAAPEQVRDVGNLKFDIPVPTNVAEVVAGFRQHLAAGRRVWIAASTHEDEEAPVLAIHARLRKRWPDLLLLWAPRHPERFPRVVEAAGEAGWNVGTRRADGWPGANNDVFVLDTLGELMAFFACADVAFVGGSLQAIGGHNMLEPAAVGTPAVTGPHLHNFSEISRLLRDADALVIAPDAAGVGDAVEDLLADDARRHEVAARGRALVEHGRGALARTLVMIAPHLPVPVA